MNFMRCLETKHECGRYHAETKLTPTYRGCDKSQCIPWRRNIVFGPCTVARFAMRLVVLRPELVFAVSPLINAYVPVLPCALGYSSHLAVQQQSGFQKLFTCFVRMNCGELYDWRAARRVIPESPHNRPQRRLLVTSQRGRSSSSNIDNSTLV